MSILFGRCGNIIFSGKDGSTPFYRKIGSYAYVLNTPNATKTETSDVENSKSYIACHIFIHHNVSRTSIDFRKKWQGRKDPSSNHSLQFWFQYF